MAQTNAQRQAAYRRRNRDPERPATARVNSVVSAHAAAALARLARHHGTTQRAVLEALILAAEGEAVDRLDAVGRRDYFDGAVTA